MKKSILLLLAMVILTAFIPNEFKTNQKKYKRVRQAYLEKEKKVDTLMTSNSVEMSKLRIYFRVFKSEEIIELWAKNSDDTKFKKIKDYKICANSGVIGPKREEGDEQVPEGFYYINRFNPTSSFYLSLGLNYPNTSDRILGTKGMLGGDIFIHGDCCTIGCMPLTDDVIKEFYVVCVEAKDNGQTKIPVTIYPTKLSDTKFASLKAEYKGDTDRINLWTDLHTAYKKFETDKTVPKLTFLKSGRHTIK
jgi:murein L,D-transpeptidase YafK